MKRISAILLCIWLTCSCMAMLAGGIVAAGGYYAGKWYQNKSDAYEKYVSDCQVRGDYPLSYSTWSRTEWRKAK